ncbi:rhomboid family intramembrane serine protease [Chiayiivirga flava]|nr:rhomboid family intramembrane serine protease [Chiayiivirga flava]
MFNDMPPITRALLASNVLVFFLQWMLGDPTFFPFMLWPLGEHAGLLGGMPVTVEFLPWQLVTYGFLHANLAHLFFNMLALVMFGGQIERVWGSRRFALYYVVCVAGAGLVQLVVATLTFRDTGNPYPTIGASGGVFGILLAFAILFPHARLMLIIPPIPMKARTFVILYGLLELFMGVFYRGSGVAHFAHLGGMAFGFLLIQYWRGRWPFRRPRPRA